MNEPASFCNYPCNNPLEQAIEQGLPPNRTTSPPPPNAPFSLSKRAALANDSAPDYLDPPYAIHVATNGLSDRSSYTDIVHANGLMEYDTRKSLIYPFFPSFTRG